MSIGSARIESASSVLVTDDADVLVVTDTRRRDPRPPNAYGAGIAFTATLVVASVLGSMSDAWASGGVGLALMAATVGVTAWWCRPMMSICAGALGWLMFNGFVADQLGTLRWHGSADIVRLGVLIGIALSVSLVRTLSIALSRRILIEEISAPRAPHRIPQSQGGTHA